MDAEQLKNSEDFDLFGGIRDFLDFEKSCAIIVPTCVCRVRIVIIAYYLIKRFPYVNSRSSSI